LNFFELYSKCFELDTCVESCTWADGSVLYVVDRDWVGQLGGAVRLVLRTLTETDQRKYRIRFTARTSLLGYTH